MRPFPVRRRAVASLAVGALTAGLLLATSVPAQAAGETVDVWLTTTSDTKGVTVTRGLQQQSPVAFAAGTATGGTTISVNTGDRRQTFEGGGASITGATAQLLMTERNSTAREQVMQKLFSPTAGIGLSFLRNPIGVSDLSPEPVDPITGQNSEVLGTLDDTCCDLNGFGSNSNNDDDDIRALTKRAKEINGDLAVKVVPWTAPAWMKSNGLLNDHGKLKPEYAPMYAQYFVKYIQRYQAAGIPVDYVSVSNEPNCRCGHVGMEWDADGLHDFILDNLYPAFRSAGISTKVLIHDWNPDDEEFQISQQTLNDAVVRQDPLFGGVAWHGYKGNPANANKLLGSHSGVDQFFTEKSGGEWVGDQHKEDMRDLIAFTRGGSKSFVKWSLALDQNNGPFNRIPNGGNGACITCTGLLEVDTNAAESAGVKYTIEYYTMGHLTKFVKPGAVRVGSTDTAPNLWDLGSSDISNVAWQNPDGTVALIAHNPKTSAQTVTVNWSGQTFTYTLPARTTATFTWKAGVGGGGSTGTTTTGLIQGSDSGKCLDTKDSGSSNGTTIQLWDCYPGSSNQVMTYESGAGTLKIKNKCLALSGNSAANGTSVILWDCNGGASQKWTRSGNTFRAMNTCMDAEGYGKSNGTRVQVWSCTGAVNQQWAFR